MEIESYAGTKHCSHVYERKYNTMDHAEENHYNILQDFVQLEVDINPKNVKVSMQGTGALSSLIITFIVKVQFNACHFKEAKRAER